MKGARFGAMLAAGLLATLGLAAPVRAQVSEQTFTGGRTSDLAALCSADPTSYITAEARAWCHGFIVGAGQYHQALAAADPARERLFCFPDASPTLDQVRTSFVNWAQANPQYGGEKAIDGLMRFAVSAWPCPASATPSRARHR
jgi:hypothetical protein